MQIFRYKSIFDLIFLLQLDALRIVGLAVIAADEELTVMEIFDGSPGGVRVERLKGIR